MTEETKCYSEVSEYNIVAMGEMTGYWNVVIGEVTKYGTEEMDCETEGMVKSNVIVCHVGLNKVNVNENLLKDLKKKSADDQKNLKKTVGGSFTPTLTDVDHQILSVKDAQIRPDVNPYDDAAEYFGDNVEENSLPEHNSQPQPNPQPQSNPQPQPNLPKSNRKRKLVLQRKNDKAVLITNIQLKL
ncbi:unnamed protein product [Diatraea saccharalis]|uniref:Uncharacterized protein n=1 Tax=Diatraea saccharalis TaxID=40085 RepID=A0A9N9WCW3_9NEOP|nr:unnamed protein product [Diatraea saccharalis]